MNLSVSVKPNLNLLTLSHAWMSEPAFKIFQDRGHFSLYLLEAMSRGPLPGFRDRGKQHPLQKPRGWYKGFDQALKTHYRMHAGEIRRGLKVEKIKEAKHFPIQLELLVKSFGKNYKFPTRKIVLTPNIFGRKGEGYGPLIGDTAYAIFTPDAKQDQTWLMVHEVCHSLLLPVFKSKKVRKLIRETEPVFEAWTTKKFRKYYPKWEWAIEEYMIHAIEQYVTESSLEEKRSWGMHRLQWFVSSWDAFQKNLKHDASLTVEDWVVRALMDLRKK